MMNRLFTRSRQDVAGAAALGGVLIGLVVGVQLLADLFVTWWRPIVGMLQ